MNRQTIQKETKLRRVIALMVGAIVVVTLVGVLIAAFSQATSSVAEAACVASGENCLRFPTISGANLPGETFTLPDDLAGNLRLVIVPFDEEQQREAAAWLPVARELAAEHAGFTYYNLPVFPQIDAPIRAVIRAGLNLTISDAELRNVTITVFLDDRDAFLDALDIPDAEQMQAFLLDDAGSVIWRGAGEFTAGADEALRAAVREQAR